MVPLDVVRSYPRKGTPSSVPGRNRIFFCFFSFGSFRCLSSDLRTCPAYERAGRQAGMRADCAWGSRTCARYLPCRHPMMDGHLASSHRGYHEVVARSAHHRGRRAHECDLVLTHNVVLLGLVVTPPATKHQRPPRPHSRHLPPRQGTHVEFRTQLHAAGGECCVVHAHRREQARYVDGRRAHVSCNHQLATAS